MDVLSYTSNDDAKASKKTRQWHAERDCGTTLKRPNGRVGRSKERRERSE